MRGLRVELPSEMDKAHQARLVVEQSGIKARPAGCALGCGYEMLGQPDALPGQAIQVGASDGIVSIAMQIIAQIVRNKHKNIRSVGLSVHDVSLLF